MTVGMDELANRLAARLWQLVSARIAARVELEVARTQAELLEQAATFRRGHGKIGDQVARRLETACERFVREFLDDAAEVEWTRDLASVAPHHGAADPLLQNPISESDPTGKRPRGRPKKAVAGDVLSKVASASDPTFGTSDEVTDEERTGARDPAGADQVPDFPA